MTHRLTPTLVAVVVAAACATTYAVDARLSREQADSFQRKVFTIAGGVAQTARQKSGDRRTPIAEGELNSWFAYQGQPLLPQGIAEPRIAMVGPGRVSGEALVDLDQIAKKRASGGVLDPWSYVGGRMPVTVTGILHTKDGIGRFQLESAEVSGVPVPKTLLQEVVAYYSRSESRPNGVNLDDPFELPADIQRIEVGPGQAVVVQ